MTVDELIARLLTVKHNKYVLVKVKNHGSTKKFEIVKVKKNVITIEIDI